MSKRQVKKWRSLAEQEKQIVEVLQKALDKSIDETLAIEDSYKLLLQQFEEQRLVLQKLEADKEFLELTLKENSGTISCLQTQLEIEHRAGVEREAELLTMQDKLTQIATFSMSPKTLEPEVVASPVIIPQDYTPSKDGDPI